MELAEITMDPAEAKEKLDGYRAAVRSRHCEEDAQIARAYRSLAQGKPVIRLPDTVRRGGYEPFELPARVGDPTMIDVPRLAVARADLRFVWTMGIHRDGSVEYRYIRESERSNGRQHFDLPPGTFDQDAERKRDWSWGLRVRAMVPNVPPPLRPRAHLRNFLILWEAEWQLDRSVPPGDPALLRPIGGELYELLAVWDLTPIEQAVLAGREP